MAARSSAGVGVGITITLLGLACLALFITTIVFYSKFQRSDRELTTTRMEWDNWVRRDEQNADTIGRLRDLARKENKSVVGYLNDSLRGTMQKVSGKPGDGPEQLAADLARVEGAGSSTLLGVIRARDASIADLTSKLQEAEKNFQTANTNLQNEAARVQAKIASYDKTIQTLTGDVDRYKNEVEQYRQQINAFKLSLDELMEKARNQFASQEAALKEQIRGLETVNLQINEQLAALRRDKSKDFLQPRAEATLVDGSVIGATPGTNEVSINLGRKDRVMLGMTFAIYANSSSITPNAEGVYPAGKATIEVINIGEATSTARITRENKGNPIVRGDVIANAIYDPKKVYTFLVYGNFDTNGDGAATPMETADIKAMIEAWSGKVTDELTGAVDYLVLGQRPVVPPPPNAGDPYALVQEYLRLDRMAVRYDELTRQAAATSIPILNENRLYTLIGRRPGLR
ncbi:MAG: hypothetical protein WD749_04740 [Phycisphaerales bacterium]